MPSFLDILNKDSNKTVHYFRRFWGEPVSVNIILRHGISYCPVNLLVSFLFPHTLPKIQENVL